MVVRYHFLGINSQGLKEKAFLWFLEDSVKFLPRGVYAGAAQVAKDVCFTTTSPALCIMILVCADRATIPSAKLPRMVWHLGGWELLLSLLVPAGAGHEASGGAEIFVTKLDYWKN